MSDLPMVPNEISALEFVDPYEFHMRSEPYVNKTPVEIDPDNGFRYTYRDVGMTRNAKEEHVRELKVYLDPVPHVVLDQNVPLRGWYKAKHEPKGVRPRPCYTEAILTQPYGGFCHVGCGFCYINNGVRGYRGQGISTVDPKYGEKVRRQLSRMEIGAAVYMSSFTDPFLELEEVYHNTQNCAQAAVDAGLPIFFLTRKLTPDWAYDLLVQNPHSYMQFSINTPDPEDWRRLSPKALPLNEMLEQVREMARRGIYVSIQVNPIMAGITTNQDILNLIHLLAEAGADHLIFKFVEIVFPSVSGLVTQMKHRFGEERGKRFEQLFTQNIGGVRTIDEGYRKDALDQYYVECKKAGVTMSLCYEYEMTVVGAISMGARYMTSAQCHGHRVPMYRRIGDRFQPMEVCPPSGCLTCADESGAPCGSEKLARADALTPQDLIKTIVPLPDAPIGQTKAAIVNLRGMNGSGKTTLLRELAARMGVYGVESITPKGCPKSYTITLLGTEESGVWGAIVGDYEVEGSITAGCDRIRTQEEARAVVAAAQEMMAPHGVVFFEGIVISTIWSSWYAFAQSHRPFIWAYMKTPYATCLERIQQRNGGKPIKEELVAGKEKAIASTQRKAIDAGETVWEIGEADPLEELITKLKEAGLGPWGQ